MRHEVMEDYHMERKIVLKQDKSRCNSILLYGYFTLLFAFHKWLITAVE